MNSITASQPVVAILCLDSGVSLYAETLRFIAWKLRWSGCKVIRIGCRRSLNTCTTFNSLNKTKIEFSAQNPVCERCVEAQTKIVADEIFDIEIDNSELPSKATDFLKNLRQRLGDTYKVVDVIDMHYEDLPICRTAFFDFSITTKLSPESILDDRSVIKFVAGVEDQLKLLVEFERLLKFHNLTHLVYVNGNYSHNTLARQFFDRVNVTCLSVEPQPTSQSVLNRVMIVKDRLQLEPEALHRKIFIEDCADYVSFLDVSRLLKNFGARINGRDFNAYTSLKKDLIPKEEAARLENFLRSYPRIHSFFLSSEDELTSHIYSHGALSGVNLKLMDPFKNQTEFTVHLITEAERHPEVGFVIRLHPRMAANKRDAFESEEHKRYKKILSKLRIPDNVLIFYGESKISSYYLISRSDLVIVAWSTIGLEALLLGTSVISAFPNYMMYPLASLSNQPSTLPELKTALFSKSDYGVPNDPVLIAWMSQAFETQFFPTAAPRSRGSLIGMTYRLFYLVLERIGMYDAIAAIVNILFLRDIRFDDVFLLAKSSGRRTFAKLQIRFLKRKLESYRSMHRRLLASYKG